ncbi:PepSY domain-containing protein [Pedobacter frigiditerrae]|uniref:PepSY domain-containing protein n=1 Tax=Pedobacter frigiditerrae TaxID=2530452 RepID=UPI002931554C|nr:PepSY domain-containing protein [Pedobacter frigiditerrae]
MTISVWRYSHLVLAISSFLLIALASITGIILAFEPVSLKTLPYKVDNFNQITLAETLPVLKKNFEEITDLTVDHNQFVIVKGINAKGDDVTVYVDPKTGKTLGVPEKQSEFFQWVTSFHRSLFLNELGRFFIGLTAFLLLLITVSGIALIIQRQRGIKRFFTKIVKENFFQYYHVTLGRILLIPILIITISGTYLSLVRFKIIPEHKVSSKVDFDSIKSDPEKKLSDFAIFKNIPLAEVNNIEFPFSEDVEDYYTLKLKDREITVNQLTGDVLTEALYPTTVLLTELSLDLHTGRTNMIWAIVLAIASCNILFFIYSGFAITLKRRSGVTKNKYKKEDCNYIILVGSENGSTFHFAKAVYQQLIKAGQKCFITELNNYTVYPKAEHLIVFTATYGLGDAPTNASKFMELLKKQPQPNKVDFSVVGFGSKSYPDFCKYAYEVNNSLSLQEWATSSMEIHTVNDRSPEEFGQWAALWSQKTEIPLTISPKLFAGKTKHLHKLVVIEKTTVKHEEGSFLIHLEPKRNLRFTSGDLLAIYPAKDHRERQYSIGKVNKNIQLSVKLHKGGLGSNFLYKLKKGQTIQAALDLNPHFHFPKKASTVIMIANGTGIAPFLGMIDENSKKVSTHLYCGFRSSSSFELYKAAIHKNQEEKKLSSLNLSYSREGNRQYVSDLVLRDKELIANAMQKDGVVMICGSLAMQKDIIEILDGIFKEINNQEVSYYQSHNRILMDCY